MYCTNKKCRRETSKMLVIFAKDGSKREGCPACIMPGGDKRVRTGKKIWAGSEVYTRSQIEQKNYDWIERTAARAAEMRRRSPLRFVKE